ncbi:hypothetical protein KSK37_02100 [Kaistella sp. DKR-2]|uniref:hypothetical protein n=1 Tax=Kaistella soli TaxID=2849654 RepID=UPI001C261EF6|nr:hypothetical protein [Kaistella soli]MBU8881868.1 hypothetical protein [Kaistella soli]
MKKLIFLSFLITFMCSNAQILDLLKDKVKDKTMSFAGEKVINAITTEAITTNFKDCNTTDVKSPGFGVNEKFTDLCNEKFSQTDGYILKPGFYQIKLKSFCLKAGTYAPSKGDGYIYAPLKGPKKEIIDALVKNWYNNQEIPQQKVQSLIWAVIAKSSLKNLDNESKLVAAKLLSKDQLLKLSKMGLDFIPASVMDKAKSNLLQPVQVALDAENKIRNFFSTSSSNYADLERLAMISGINPEKSDVQYGTWGLQPEGYWISYQPHGYREMEVKIYVPSTVSSVNFIPSDHVAVPANTSSQRLMLSDMLNCN